MDTSVEPTITKEFDCEVAIIGGGPAGLSAALVLGRALRHVLIFDGGVYRNTSSKAMHGFLTRDGICPEDFLAIARKDLEPYSNVQRIECVVEDVEKHDVGFGLKLADGKKYSARKLILATGLSDILPSVEGAREIYGTRLHHCPYCDGWEVRHQPLCVYGRGDAKGAGLALEMTQWSPQITLCTDGPDDISAEYKDRLKKNNLLLDERRIRRLEKTAEGLRVHFQEGPPLEARAMFFNIGTRRNTNFAEKLGCEIVEEGTLRSESIAGKTCVNGVYIIGDASRDVLQVIVAAGEGSAAAISINTELLREDGRL